MTPRELIAAEIGKIPDDRLNELYGVIRDFATSASTPAASSGAGILAKLREIHIEAPADFAENLELYLRGEKHVPEDVH